MYYFPRKSLVLATMFFIESNLLASVMQSAIVLADPELRISPPQGYIASPTGKDYSLMCEGISEDGEDLFTDMKWVNPRDEIIEEGTPGVKQHNSNQLKLSFIKPAVEESGQYNCTALYSKIERLHASVHVTFYEDIRFDECPEQQDLVVGKSGDIRCHPTASPPPKVRWEKDMMGIESDRYSISPDGIHIANVTEHAKGLYTVEAFVAVTGSSKCRSIVVNVLTPPKITSLGETYEVVHGKEYTLLCQAEGSPPLQYTWLDPMLRDLSKEEGFKVEGGKLTISRVERNEGGNYKCMVENGAGRIDAIFRLVVLVPPNIVQLDNITRKTGDEALLLCRAEGEPKPMLSIRRDRDIMDIETGQDDRIDVEQVSDGESQLLTLRIRNVRRSDHGLYYCKASNDVGTAEKVGNLEVFFPPNVTATPTTHVRAWPTKPANLTCTAEANPNATLLWKFNSYFIKQRDPGYKIYSGKTKSQLLVYTDRIHDEKLGTYTCVAKNSLGEASIDIVLEEATSPGQLSQIVFDKVTLTTISFMFLGPSDDGGLPILGYHAKYRIEGQTSEQELEVKWQKGSSYILNNLKPRVLYRFSFAAYNEAGEGPWKTETYVMPSGTVPDPPKFVTKEETVSDYPDRFRVRFIIPEDNGAHIQYFEMRYFKVEKRINEWQQISRALKKKILFEEVAQNPIIDLYGLSPDTFYRVELRANNNFGNSFPGTLVFRTGRGLVNAGHTSKINSEVTFLLGLIAVVLTSIL